jgi:hypothetical protein
MTTITKENCIEKTCNLPLDFKVSDKSSLTLLQESKFADFYNDITKQDIKDYLSRHKNLIDNWEIWSEDKRTWGYYLSISPDKYFVGSLDKDGKENFSKSFSTAIDACAEFILREVSAILDIKNNKNKNA